MNQTPSPPSDNEASRRKTRSRASLPSQQLSCQQSIWLRGARSRLLRVVDIARRRSILDLGAGWGYVSAELAERSQTTVIALDQSAKALGTIAHPGVRPVCADAHDIPLTDASIDLVVTESAFLWFSKPATVVREIARVLTRDGVVASVEPDFGGLIESPEPIAVRDVWIDALRRNDAEPNIGRQLPALFANEGFDVDILLLDRVVAPSPSRFDLLTELPLTPDETSRVDRAKQFTGRNVIAHLPYFLTVARRR